MCLKCFQLIQHPIQLVQGIISQLKEKQKSFRWFSYGRRSSRMPSDSVWVEFEEVKQNKFQLLWLRASKCTWEVSRARQKLELLSALQTFRVLHISMNARWRMNQLLMVNWSTRSHRTTRADNNAASCSCPVSRSCNCNWRKMLQHHTATTWNSSVRFGFCRHFECVLLNTFC